MGESMGSVAAGGAVRALGTGRNFRGPQGPGACPRAAGPRDGDALSGAANTDFAARPARHGGPGQLSVLDPDELALRRASGRPEIARVLGLVAAHDRVDAALLFHASRCRAEVAMARQLAMYLMNVVLSLSFTEIGQVFGRDRTTVRHACALIEDRRDDPGFDAELDRMEAGLKAVAAEEPDCHVAR
jgi:hypothetical protein